MKVESGIVHIEGNGKARVSHGKYSVNYDVVGEIDVPLQFGDGEYSVEILKKVSQNRYALIRRNKIIATESDSYLLKPNCYVPYVADAWDEAKAEWWSESSKESYKGVTEWAKSHLIYDYVKAATVPTKGVMPDPFTTWNTKLGICQDISSLVCGMLRAAGVPSRMVIGLANGRSHAWVEAMVDGKWKRYDHSGMAKSYQRQRWY